MLKKSVFVAATAAGLLMLGSPAMAGSYDNPEEDVKTQDNLDQTGLVNVNGILSDSNIGVCDNNISPVSAQIPDLLSGGVNLLSPNSGDVSDDTCVADASMK